METVLTQNQKEKSQRKTFQIVKRLLSYVWPYWQMKAALSFIVAATVLDIITPTIIGSTIDVIENLATSGTLPTGAGSESFVYKVFVPIAAWVSKVFGMDSNFAVLSVLSLSIIVVASLTGLLNYMQRYFLAYVSQKGSYEVRSDIYTALLDQSFTFYDQQRTGQIMARATADVDESQRFIGFGFERLIASGLLFGLVIYSLFSINWQLAVLSMLFLPVMLYTTLRFTTKIGPIWVSIRNLFGNLTSDIQENLMGVRVVRGFSREDFEEQKFRADCNLYFKKSFEGSKLRAFYLPLATLISSIGTVLIVWYGGNQVITGVLTLGNLVTFYFYILRLAQPIRMIGFISTQFQRAVASADRIFSILDVKTLVSDKEGALELKATDGHIVFRNVWFSYTKDNMVLRNINLDVKPGETIAILGATGSGKSSIINLIPRFYDVTQGSITIDGHDLRDVTLKSLRKHIGIVRQDPFIFSTTLKENIAYGVENTSQEAIETAAKKAKIHDFIVSQPEGYNTRVGERGVTLSGGQKQRIAIARALLKDPKILILDDSTSSVDMQTEFEIQLALEALFKGRTTFIITQRLSSIRNAGYIIVLENGEIAEEGTHEQLLAKRGVYYKLHQTQIGEKDMEEES
ncbi:MAG: ABC transporter ATP-binding protein [Candidatus Bathyarchaeota archaeon]